MTERRTAPISFRIRPSLKADLVKLAEDDKRTLASYIELVLEEHVQSKGGTPRKPRGKEK